MDVGIYFVVFFTVFLINAFVPKTKTTWLRRLLLATSITILVCFIGFRYNVGTDYNSYLEIYKNIKGESLQFALSQNIDPLNGFLLWVLSQVVSIDYLIFFIYGIASILPIYIVNRHFEYKYLSWSLLVYCFMFLPFSLNGMMQASAMSLVLLASLYISRSKFKKFLIAFIMAILFHKSALFVAPHFTLQYIFRNNTKKLAKWNAIYTVFASVFILYFLNDFLASNDIGLYNSYSYILNKISIDKLSLSTTIYYLPLALFSYITRTHDDNKQVALQRNMIYSGIIYNIVGSSAQYLNRIALYFTVMSPIVIPFQIMKMNNLRKQMLLKVLLLTYILAAFIVQVIVLGWHDLIPYQTWLFEGAI